MFSDPCTEESKKNKSPARPGMNQRTGVCVALCQDRIVPPNQAVVHPLLHTANANYNSHLHIIPDFYRAWVQIQQKKETENSILHQFLCTRCISMLYSAMCIIYQSFNSGTVKLAKQDSEKATKQQASDHHSWLTNSEKQSTDQFNKKKF